MSKADIKRRLSAGERVKIVSPMEHKFYGVIRKADKIQTNAVRFEGGSWLYFNDIDKETPNGFTLKPLGDSAVSYEWVSPYG